MKKEVMMVLLGVFFISGICAQEYYVSSTGSALWSQCTNINTPCSLATANTNVQAGDTVYLRGGEYFITGSGINPSNTGVEGSPITYKNYNNEYVQFIDASGSSTCVNLNSRCWFQGNPVECNIVRNHIKVDGITCTDFFMHLWILYGSYNEITNSNFIGYSYNSQGNIQWRGSTIYENAKYNHIHNNTFGGYGSWGTNNQPNYHSGVVFELGNEHSQGDGTSYNLIEKNHFYHSGHHVFGWQGNYNVIRNNYFHNEPWWDCKPETPQCPTDAGPNNLGGYRVLYTLGWASGNYRNLLEGNRVSFGGNTPTYDTHQGGSGGHYGTPYNIIRRNIFDNNANQAMYINSAYRATFSDQISAYNKIYHNVFFNNGHEADTTHPYFTLTGTHPVFLHVPHRQSPYTEDQPGTWDYIFNNSFKNNIFYNNHNNAGNNKDISIVRGGYHWQYSYYEGNGIVNQFIANNSLNTINPKFIDISGEPDPMNWHQYDFRLQPDSPVINAGGFLTKITSPSGSGNQFQVNDAGYFMDGWGMEILGVYGDIIQLEGSTKRVMITNIDYETNVITINESISWIQGQGVTLAYEGSAPDIGAYEYFDGQIVIPEPDPEPPIEPDPEPPQQPTGIITLQDMLNSYQDYRQDRITIETFLEILRTWIIFK